MRIGIGVLRLTATLSAATLLVAFLINCSNAGRSSGEVKLQGAGATFPNPLYQKWFSEYNKITPNAKFDYQSIGSGGGIKQISSRTVDFGGSDAPMKDEQLKSAPGEILHIPTVLGADVLTYNLPGVETELKLTPEAVAGIFLGKIKKWNDKAITSSNAGVNFPKNDITVVHRSEGSGTTFVWTDYLSKVSPEWKEKVGTGASVNWPVGIGAKGNEGVTGQVKQTPYSIGYVELIYAVQNKLPYASIRNSSGEFVRPSISSITASAAAGQIPDDLRVSITNIAERAVELNRAPEVKLSSDYPMMAEAAQKMLKDALDAFVNQDVDLAQKVLYADDYVDILNEKLFRDLLSWMTKSPSDISCASHLMFVAKYLERVGDHSSNIAEMVVFMVEGRDIRHLEKIARLKEAPTE